jgi:hypothetical protein
MVIIGLVGLAASAPAMAATAAAGLAGAVARAAPATAPAKAPVPLGSRAEVGGASAVRGANACSWTVRSPGIEKTFTFDALAGTYEMTSFKNLLVSPVLQYVTAGAPSGEFRFTWDGVTLSGDGGGWSCAWGRASRIDAGGAPALELDVSLSRPSVSVRVTKHYVVYPDVALIREWTDYANTDPVAAHGLSQPSFLEQKVMGDVVADTDLLTMGGTADYAISSTPLTADYSDTIAGARSADRMPWYGLWDRVRKAGIYAGFDFMGSWAVPVGVQDGSGTSLSMYIPDYSEPVAAGGSVSSPKAFDGVYRTDLDDMTNRLLDWQYGYMWDYTRAPYFTAVRDEGFWCEGARVSGCEHQVIAGWDQQGTLQKVFGLSDSMRAMGVDTFHRDYGWWDFMGDWGGEDWKITNSYLAKSGMSQIIYIPIYLAEDGAQVLKDHPDLFSGNFLDMTIPAGRQWAIDSLVTDAREWGDFEWRPDFGSFPTLAIDQGYRAVIQGFLDARPGSGFHAVNGGGTDYWWDYLRFADGGSFTDYGGVPQIDGASKIFPVDKLSGVPEFVSEVFKCDDTWMAAQLTWNPDMSGDTSDPAMQECVRKTTDLYHYITVQGVAGRWTGQYHPRASDGRDSIWFQRVSGDRQRSLVIYKGGMRCGDRCSDVLPLSGRDVTVYPKGLNPDQVYDVRFQYQGGVAQRTGADLMANGVTFTGAVHAGELIWLNLPGHPGAGTDHAAPSAPPRVTATTATNMSYPGVDVSWTAASDNNWLSYYEVLRDGTVIGKVAKGTYFFDHTAAATPTATYAVRAVDGDGIVSGVTAASPAGGPASVTADDSSAAVIYTGKWSQEAGASGPSGGTQSEASGLPCHLACQDFSGAQGAGGWSYHDGPPPPCHLACQGFSGVQGANGWSFQNTTAGVWADIDSYQANLGFLGECCAWLDFGNGDFSGLVSPRLMLPGAGHDVARAWTAPKDGVVDILAQAIPLFGGNQSVLTITRNGQPVWGPQTMDGTMTPLDTGVANVAVSAGDVIRFEIQGTASLTFSDITQWDPDIHYQGDPPLPPLPGWTDMATYHGDDSYVGDGTYWHGTAGFASAHFLEPAQFQDVARTWTAPRDGTVDIGGHAAGGGASVSITRNGEVVWGPQAAGDTDANVSGVSVATGDVIRFQVAAGGGRVQWDPDIWYEGDPQPAVVAVGSASWTFTGSQVTWSAGLSQYSGIAQVSIDGKPDTLIDLFASDVNSFSVPIYTKTFPVAGTHTITITPTGNKNAQSLGSAVDVDGFRAVTGLVSVTEDVGHMVSYDGSGWAAQSSAPASAGRAMVSSHAGDSVSFRFNASSITWVGRICPSCGVADVYLDGRYATRVDAYAFRGPDVWQAALFQYSWDRPGSHVIKLVVTGQPDWSSQGSQIYVDNFRTG